MKIVYHCEGCGEGYPTAARAEACEATVMSELEGITVGMIVKAGPGFGWFDGDERWVVNPENHMDRRRGPCPKGTGNCFGWCCTMGFYYVVTAIDTHPKYHERRYHLRTRAMSGEEGYAGGWVSAWGNRLEPVAKPPAVVAEQAKELIGYTTERGL